MSIHTPKNFLIHCILNVPVCSCFQLEPAAVAIGLLSPKNGGKGDTSSKDKLRDCVFELAIYFCHGRHNNQQAGRVCP